MMLTANLATNASEGISRDFNPNAESVPDEVHVLFGPGTTAEYMAQVNTFR